MTIDEARKIATIASTADGGCCYCVDDLRQQLQAVFPEFRWEYWGLYPPTDDGPEDDDRWEQIVVSPQS